MLEKMVQSSMLGLFNKLEEVPATNTLLAEDIQTLLPQQNLPISNQLTHQDLSEVSEKDVEEKKNV